jgi:hypothetical protein
VSFAVSNFLSTVETLSNFLSTVLVKVTDEHEKSHNMTRGLMDPGAQINLISSLVISRLDCPMWTRDPPVRISGLRPDKDIITDQIVRVRLLSRFTGFDYHTFEVMVVPGVEWKYHPPRLVCHWLQCIDSVLADATSVDPSLTDLPFSIKVQRG